MKDRPLRRLLLDSGIIIALSAAAAFGVNSIREVPVSLKAPLFVHSECGTGQEAEVITAQEALLLFGDRDTAYVDIRSGTDFSASHIKGALSLPFSLLESYTEDDLAALRGKKRVIVYDLDGTGGKARMAASEFIEAGVRGVFVLEGGILHWLERGGPAEGRDLSALRRSPSHEKN